MGVIGLQTFIERFCPGVLQSVSIKALADDHRRRFHVRYPKIVVDGMCLLNNIYSEDLEWFYGGQWLQYFEKLKYFISCFTEIGVKLVFFFDGAVPLAKRNEWVRRRVQKCKENERTFSRIQASGEAPNNNQKLPTSAGTVTYFAVKKLNEETYLTDRDADEVIAHYAQKNVDVFAIVTQDSDFVIFNTKKFLYIKDLNLSDMTTIWCDRDSFATYLGLNIHQLPLFACLAGNDYVSKDNLKPFHEAYTSNKGPSLALSNIGTGIANLIKTRRWLGDYRNIAELEEISIEIFRDTRYSKVLEDALLSYELCNTESILPSVSYLNPRVRGCAYQKHINCVNDAVIYNILINQEYGSSEVLEDSSKAPVSLVYRGIRRRCYGVLFNENSPQHLPKSCRVFINEWCAHVGNLMEEPEIVSPLPSYFFNPYQRSAITLEGVWFEYTEEEKMMLFHAILEAPISLNIFLRIPKHQIVLVSILNYLLGNSDCPCQLEPLDVAAFVTQSLFLMNTTEIAHLKIPYVDAHAVHLATLFMRGLTAILMIWGTCGNPFPIEFLMPWRFFDGKLFHHTYLMAKERRNISYICRNLDEMYLEFHKLLCVSVDKTAYEVNTFDWCRILQDFNYNCL